MIDRVVIVGLQRAGVALPRTEISQMIGRCGRSYTRPGRATLIVSCGEGAEASEYLSPDSDPIRSSLGEPGNAAFAVVPEIYHGRGMGKDEFEAWAARSLAHVQGRTPSWEDVKRHLLDCGCAREREDGRLFLTEMGKLSYQFYASPERIHEIKARLERVSRGGHCQDVRMLSWALASGGSAMECEDPGFLDYVAGVNSIVRYFDKGEHIDGYAIYCILCKERPSELRGEIRRKRRDARRLFSLAREISRTVSSEMERSMECCQKALEEGIPFWESMLRTLFPSIGKGVISELDSLSLHCMADILKSQHIIETRGSRGLKEFYYECVCKAVPGQAEG